MMEQKPKYVKENTYETVRTYKVKEKVHASNIVRRSVAGKMLKTFEQYLKGLLGSSKDMWNNENNTKTDSTVE